MESFAPAHAERRTLHFTHRYAARAADVYAAWVQPALVRQWLFATAGRPLVAAGVEARRGGALVLRDRWRGRALVYRGTFTRLEPGRALGFTLECPDAPGALTAVAVAFAPDRDGCGVDVVPRDVPPLCTGTLEARWLGALYGLGEILEAGTRARARGTAVGAE